MFYVLYFHIPYFEHQNMLIKNKVFSTFEVYIRGFIVEFEKILTHTSKKFTFLTLSLHISNFMFEYEKLVSKI